MNENKVFIWEESNKSEFQPKTNADDNILNTPLDSDNQLDNSIDWIFCINNNDTHTIHNYLSLKSKTGKDIPLLQKEIIEILEKKEFNYDLFWNFVYILLTFNSKLFLSTLVNYIKNNKEKIPQCEEQLFENILYICFIGTEKIQHSFELIKYSNVELNYSQTKKILDACLKSKKTETIENFFNFFKTPTPIKINLLRDNIQNESVLYLLYKTYNEAKKRNLINSDTIVEVYSYPYITSLINELRKLSEIHVYYSKLLESEILGKKNHSSYFFRNKIKIEGEKFTQNFLNKKLSECKLKEKRENIKYNELSRFYFVRELDNHYYFTSKDYSMGALMAKPLSNKNHFNSGEAIDAYIYKYSKSHSMLFLYQKIIKDYIEPSIINNNTEIIISFNKYMQPRIRNYADIFRVRISNIEYVTDYKKKYVAKIIKRISLFRYYVVITGVL